MQCAAASCECASWCCVWRHSMPGRAAGCCLSHLTLPIQDWVLPASVSRVASMMCGSIRRVAAAFICCHWASHLGNANLYGWTHILCEAHELWHWCCQCICWSPHACLQLRYVVPSRQACTVFMPGGWLLRHACMHAGMQACVSSIRQLLQAGSVTPVCESLSNKHYCLQLAPAHQCSFIWGQPPEWLLLHGSSCGALQNHDLCMRS